MPNNCMVNLHENPRILYFALNCYKNPHTSQQWVVFETMPKFVIVTAFSEILAI